MGQRPGGGGPKRRHRGGSAHRRRAGGHGRLRCGVRDERGELRVLGDAGGVGAPALERPSGRIRRVRRPPGGVRLPVGRSRPPHDDAGLAGVGVRPGHDHGGRPAAGWPVPRGVSRLRRADRLLGNRLHRRVAAGPAAAWPNRVAGPGGRARRGGGHRGGGGAVAVVRPGARGDPRDGRGRRRLDGGEPGDHAAPNPRRREEPGVGGDGGVRPHGTGAVLPGGGAGCVVVGAEGGLRGGGHERADRRGHLLDAAGRNRSGGGRRSGFDPPSRRTIVSR